MDLNLLSEGKDPMGAAIYDYLKYGKAGFQVGDRLLELDGGRAGWGGQGFCFPLGNAGYLGFEDFDLAPIIRTHGAK